VVVWSVWCVRWNLEIEHGGGSAEEHFHGRNEARITVGRGFKLECRRWKEDRHKLDQTKLPPPPYYLNHTNIQRIAYVYKAKREINGSRVRVIWGRISRPHGSNGAVKSKFTSNLPAKTFGASCRIVRLLLLIQGNN